jgi:hypothetical protein
MTNDLVVATWVLAAGTGALAVITVYYTVQTRNLVKRERRALEVSMLEDELEQAVGALFGFVIAIRAAFQKEYPTIDLDNITEGYDQVLILYLRRSYLDNLMISKSHLIGRQVMAHWITEQWVREPHGLDRKLSYVAIHVSKETLARMLTI